jgi:uncharacterized protein YbjT (DUF2867 family)
VPTNSAPKILVTGATGTTGGAVVRQLAKAGMPARALVRDQSKLNLSGVEVVEGDLGTAASLIGAMAGIEVLYLNIVPGPNALAQIDNAIATARDAGVSRIVKLSGLYASAASSSAIIRMHSEGDDKVRASGLGFTILRANSFYQNILSQLAGIKSTGMFYLPLGTSKQSMIDVEDIAAAVITAMTDQAHTNQTYDLTGPESLTQLEVAEKLAQASGHPVAYVPIPNEQFAETLRGYGMAAPAVTDLAELFALFASDAVAEVTHDLEKILSRPGRRYAQFADQLFRQGAPT